MDEILLKLTELEIEIENIEPSRKEELLDLIDAFRASVIQILTPIENGKDDGEDEHRHDNPSIIQ
mgnify:FL=1